MVDCGPSTWCSGFFLCGGGCRCLVFSPVPATLSLITQCPHRCRIATRTTVQAGALSRASNVGADGAGSCRKAVRASLKCCESVFIHGVHAPNIAELRRFLSYKRFGRIRTVRRLPLHYTSSCSLFREHSPPFEPAPVAGFIFFGHDFLHLGAVDTGAGAQKVGGNRSRPAQLKSCAGFVFSDPCA